MFKLSIKLLLGLVILPVVAADLDTLHSPFTAYDSEALICVEKLQTFDELLEDASFGTLNTESHTLYVPPGYYDPTGTPRMRIERLRDSAYYFAQRGDNTNCQLMLLAMQEIYNEHQGLVGLEFDDFRIVRFWRKVHLKRARPINSMEHLLRAAVIIGAEVRNREDELLGVIRDVIVDTATQDVRYVLIANGGFLGFGQTLSVARWTDLFATTDHELFVLEISKELFADAPTLNAGSVAQLADNQWQGQLEKFWNTGIGN